MIDFCSFNDILTCLEEDNLEDNLEAVILGPPNVLEDTDTESGDEEEHNPSHFTPSMREQKDATVVSMERTGDYRPYVPFKFFSLKKNESRGMLIFPQGDYIPNTKTSHELLELLGQ